MNFLVMIGFLRQKPYAVLIQKELFLKFLPFHEPGIRWADCSTISDVRIDSLPFCVANFTGKIQRNSFAPFRFLTPFPLRSSRRLRNSARQPFHFEPDVRVISISTRLILSCSNILGGRFHRFPSMNDWGRLNLQSHFIHSCVFYPHYLEENRFIQPLRN